jgi:hypothetical protein
LLVLVGADGVVYRITPPGVHLVKVGLEHPRRSADRASDARLGGDAGGRVAGQQGGCVGCLVN